MSIENRHYERIPMELSCRLFIPDSGHELRFESFNSTINLSLGGVYLASDWLLPVDTRIFAELDLPEGQLPISSRVAHRVEPGTEGVPSGMGIEFLEVDADAREMLLRFFAPDRYQAFYKDVGVEFPHLHKAFGLADVALLVNLWREWENVAAGGPRGTDSGAPAAPEPTTKARRKR